MPGCPARWGKSLPWPLAHQGGHPARLIPWGPGRLAWPRWVLCWLKPENSGTVGPRPTQYPSVQLKAYHCMIASGAGRCVMQLHQLYPQTCIWKLPKTCKIPILEGAPYHWGYTASPGRKTMSMPSSALPLLSNPPIFMNHILVSGFGHLARHILFRQHGICPPDLYLCSGGGEVSFVPKSWICWHVACRDFFWPTTKTFSKRVLEGKGAWYTAKRWYSKRASSNAMDKARKKMLSVVLKAKPILICHHLGPLLIPLHSKGLQILKLLGAQANPLSLK